jgi:AcrR family transcriptional regulator
MAREKDESKRQAILAAAKRLFAERGFHGASVSDLARETGLPVGSIYTYFENKDDVARTVIEEGWEVFFQELVSALEAADGPAGKLSIVVDRFLPALFRDVDLITLILSEAGRTTNFEEKLDRLAELFRGIVDEMSAKRGLAFDFSPRQAKAAVTLYFLGCLDTVRLARDAGLSVSPDDVLRFVRTSVENTFGSPLDPGADKRR